MRVNIVAINTDEVLDFIVRYINNLTFAVKK